MRLMILENRQPEPDADAIANGSRIRLLAQTAVYGSSALTKCPYFLRQVLETHSWRHFANPDSKQTFDYAEDQFDDFARAHAPRGLSVPDGLDGVIRICTVIGGDDAKVCLPILRGFHQEAKPAKHAGTGRGNKTVSNVNGFKKGGNRESYLIGVLKRDHPKLAARVLNGELKAHAAAIQAGFLKRPVQHQPTIEGYLKSIQKHLSAEAQRELVHQLFQQLS